MKHKTRWMAATLLIGVLFFTSAPVSFASGWTDAQVREFLQQAVDEEYLARDTYQAILETHGDLRPMSRIVRSEQRHIDLLRRLAEEYGVELKEPTEKVSAPDTLEASLARAIEIEEADIAELQELLKQDLPEDLENVLKRLLRGSQQHLSAFVRAQSGEPAPGGRGMRKGEAERSAGGAWTDEDGDGFCDNCSGAPGMRGGRGPGRFGSRIDEDGEGICDYRQTPPDDAQ